MEEVVKFAVIVIAAAAITYLIDWVFEIINVIDEYIKYRRIFGKNKKKGK